MAESFNRTQFRVGRTPIPETGRIEHADTQQPKLKLRVTAAGHRSFARCTRTAGAPCGV